MVWTILGIEQTKDKKAITRAYRDRLTNVNPEEKPEEFKELRSAYEEALRLADQEEKPQAEKTPVDLWVDDLAELYQDLQRRIDVEAWKELVSQDICMALDSRPMIEEAMLAFFMDHFHIPHEVMLFLNDVFAFTEHIDELAEKFPKEFLQYIIVDSIRFEDKWPYDMYSPGWDGKEADLYYELYRQALNTETDNAEDIYRRMEECSETHPYGQAFLLRIRLGQGEEAALSELEALCEEWPEDFHLALELVNCYAKTGQMEQAEKLSLALLEKKPQDRSARFFLAKALEARGELKEAVDIIAHLMQESGADQSDFYELSEYRVKMQTKRQMLLEKQYEEAGHDDQICYDLAWTYIDCDKMKEAAEYAGRLNFEQPERFGYYNIKAIIAKAEGRYEEAYAFEKQLLAVVESLQPDGTKRTEELMHRKGEVYGRIAISCSMLKRLEEALETGEKAIAENPKDVNVMLNMAELYNGQKEYEKTVELANRVIDLAPRGALGYYLRAYAYYKMEADNAAFEDICTALDLDGSSLPYYHLKLMILLRNGAFDVAEEQIAFLEELGVEEDPMIDYCKVWIFYDNKDEERKQAEFQKMLALAASVDERLKSGEYDTPEWAGDFYHLYALLLSEQQNYPVERLLKVLDKGLAMEPDNYSCLSYKGWILRKSDRWADALAMFKELEKQPRRGLFVEEQLAQLYFEELPLHAGDALHYYKLLIERDPENADLYFYAGMCCLRMEKLEEAEVYFKKEQEYAPGDVDGYYRMAFVLQKMNRLEESIEQAKKAIAIAKENPREGNQNSWLPLIRAYRRMGRVEEAVAAAEDCQQHNPDWSCMKLIFSIYLQAGRYEDAEQHIRKWKRSWSKAQGWADAEAILLIVQKKMRWLSMHLLNARTMMSEDTIRLAEAVMASYKGNSRKYLKIKEKAYREMLREGYEDSAIHGHYVWALWVDGQLEEAGKHAELQLKQLQEEAGYYSGDRLLYECKMIPNLAILGRMEEARKLAEQLKEEPLCEMCDYNGCKDRVIFLIQLELIAGNYEKARSLARKAMKKWADDTDYIELEYIANMKEKK